ncbi:MAG: PAS domain S-box protein [Methanomicrobiales archaeon]
MIRILLVDDEPALLDIARIFIEREEGLRVTTCPSAFDAMRLLSGQERFDVIVSDYEMPAMDGIEFLKKIREDGNKTPFIIFTGRGREQVVIEALNYGADFYLQKGGDPKSQFAELRNMVRQACKRKEAEEAHIRSERQLYDIINFLPDATFAIDREGKVIAWNRAIEDMTGVAASGMLGKGDYEYAIPFYGKKRKILIDLLYEEDEQIRVQYYNNITRDGHGIIAETEVPELKKKPTIVWAKATPFYDNDGNIIGAIESIRDITHLKEYEASILEGKDRFQELTELLPQSVFEIDISGKILYANQRTFDMFGYPRGELGDWANILEMLVPDEHERARKGIQALVEGTGNQGEIFTAVRKDGVTFPIQIFASPIIQNGEISGLRGIIIDLSEIRAAEEKVKESRRLFKSLVENMPDGIFILDWDGTILFTNQYVTELVGLPGGEPATGRNVFDFLVDDGLTTARYQLAKVKEGHPLLGEYRIKTISGEERWVEGRGRITSFQGRSAVLLIARDITERRKSEDLSKSQMEWNLRYHQALLDLARTDLTIFTPAVRHILETDAAVLGVERVSFWICDDDRKGITCRDLYTRSKNSHEEGGHLDARGHPVYFHELGQQRLITADDVKEHFCTKELFEDYLSPHGITSMMDVPVWLNGHVIGIVCHEHIGDQRTWGEREQEFATSVADYISLAIETSKRHRIEEILRESETTTGALLDATHEAAVLITETGVILKINEVAAKWFHMNMDDILETNVFHIVPDDYAAALQERTSDAVKNCIPLSFEISVDNRIIENSINPIRDTDGRVRKLAIFGRDITSKKAYALALEERERFLNNIFSSIRDGISILDHELRIIRVNPTMEEWYAHQMPLVGKKCYEAYHLSKEPCEKCPSTRTISSGVPNAETVPKIGPGGKIDGWFELFSFPLIDAKSDELKGVIEYVRDITDRKLAEDELKETNAKLKMAISISEMQFWEWNIVNDHLSGLPSEDRVSLQGSEFTNNFSDFMNIVHPDDRERIESTISAAIARWPSDPDFAIEFRMVFPEEQTEWIRAIGRVIADDSGQPVRLTGVGLYITRYKQLEEELRENEERLQLAIDGGDVGIWECDVTPEANVTVSRKVLEILGFQTESTTFEMSRIEKLVHPDDAEKAVSSLKEFLSGNIPLLNEEYRILCNDETYKWLLLRGKVIRYDSSGRPARVAGTVVDISEMRKYREMIELTNRRLHLLNSITRHDLLNQLTILKGALELLTAEPTSDRAAPFVKMIQKATTTIERQITFTQDYQDIGMNEPAWQDLSDTITRASTLLHNDRVAIDNHVGKVRVLADPLLEKVFYNLIDNSLRYGGEPLTTIQVLAREDESGLAIILEDDGIGITRKDKARIFERGVGQNTGLGLFLVSEILSITGITIVETGEAGNGARFEIHVPRGRYAFDYCKI